MPEGDTIYRAAAKLRRALVDRTIAAAAGHDPRREFPAATLVDDRLVRVESRGKHLLMYLRSSRVIHSHMGMTGAWHVYDPGQAWRKPRRFAALAVTLENGVRAVCFTPKLLELLTATELRRHAWLHRLGPDLLADDFSVEEALPRFRVHNQQPIGEAVMNQTIVAGIGNVYKSELLFLRQLAPTLPVSAIDDEGLLALLKLARQLLRRNLDSQRRRTRFGRDGLRLWVYDRQGEACLKCGARIVMQRQGDLGRSTYWCPECQTVKKGIRVT